MSMVPKGPIGLTYRLSLLFGGYDGGLGMVVCTSTRVMVMVIYLGSNHEHVGEWELRLMRFQLRKRVYKCRKYLDCLHTHVCWGMPKPSNSGNILITYNDYFTQGPLLTLIVDCYSVWAGPSIYWDIYIYTYFFSNIVYVWPSQSMVTGELVVNAGGLLPLQTLSKRIVTLVFAYTRKAPPPSSN